MYQVHGDESGAMMFASIALPEEPALMFRHLASIVLLWWVSGACGTDAGSKTEADAGSKTEADTRDGPDASIEVVDGRRMALVPAGSFPMGCDYAEYQAREDLGCDDLGSASPVHTVSVPAYMIDVTEVTQADYGAFLQATGRPEPLGCEGWDLATRGAHPFSCADWADADAFCRWSGNRLCTEAEWEMAARGPGGLRHPWGNEPPTCDRANLLGCTGQPGETLPVGTHPTGASPFGVEDMLGNASEWAEDDHHHGHEGAPTDGSARVDSPRATISVVKGGNFTSDRWTDASSRAVGSHLSPGESMSFGPGIRCCRSAPGEP